ncbi:hypothetical protein BpHYR1_046876 [Brachionus plicatilis]|uniref:Uncharacterized protein n=1 Tax=Brachionus plicatilis TaxID=10195 RepID=A0A3M7PXQ0_BRAPC|nr:hypothetical protein BpHYR1_046876 [Brachionus plicatilis]
MDADLIQVLSDETISSQLRIQKKKDRCIKQLVTNYQKDRIDLFIDGICEVYVRPCTKYPTHGIKACVAKQGDTDWYLQIKMAK